MNITLNGRDYPLRFSVNALCCLEEKTNLSLSGLQGRQMSCIRGLIWCGLRRIVKDRRHTGLVYHSLKVVLMFQLIPLTDILFRIAGIMDIQWNRH